MSRPPRLRPRKIFRRLAIGSVVAVVGPALFLALTVGVDTEPFRDAQGRVLPRSVAAMEGVEIGGVEQMLWFRGVSSDHPALVLLHGGPGASESALFRHYNSELEEHFLVVYWEQRGAGRSFDADIPPDTMTIERFVADLDEVVDVVQKRFDKEKVVLLGHSWGTALGALYAHEHPEKVAAYVGVGQVANMPVGETRSYEFALAEAEARKNQKAITELERIGSPPHTVDEMLTSRKWVERFGGSFYGDLFTGGLIWAALQTDEASWWDLVLFGRGNQFSLRSLWPEFRTFALDERYLTFEVPVFFLEGRHDWQVPAVVAEGYFGKLDAPVKKLFWFESGHNPPFEAPDRFNRVLIEEVLPLVK